MDFKGKVAMITGSGRGLGKATALALARRKCDIIINDRGNSNEEVQKTVKEIRALGVKCEYMEGDVSDFESCRMLANSAKEKFGKLDILVNNAGITKDRTLKNMSQEEWNSVIQVNLNSMFNVTRNVLELIPDGGRIINISSIVGITGNFGQTNYAATKAGIIGFTKSLAKELGKRKITVNAIAPGFINSPMTDKIPVEMLDSILSLIPMREMGAAEDVANGVVFLASENARYITGIVLRIDGGLSF